jgi:hypothetical protein
VVAGVAVAAGLILTGVGVAGAVSDWGSTTSSSASKPTPAPTTAKPTPGETPQQFLDQLSAAVRAGDVSSSTGSTQR